MNDPRKSLRPVGVVQGPQSFPAGDVEIRRLEISKAAKLTDLSERYHFYTPALFYLAVANAPEPFASFVHETGSPAQQMSLSFDKHIFSNVGDWANVLYAIEEEHWSAYASYMGTVAMRTAAGAIYRVRFQSLEIPDPLDNTIEPALVPVTAFAIEANYGSFYFRSFRHNNHVVNIVATYDKAIVFEDHQAFTDAFNAQLSDPYKASEDESKNPFSGRGGS